MLQEPDTHLWRERPRGTRPPAPGHPPARQRQKNPSRNTSARPSMPERLPDRRGALDRVTKIPMTAMIRQTEAQCSREARRRSRPENAVVPARRLRRVRSAVAPEQWRARAWPPPPKVGCNDPCPRGSGKKYALPRQTDRSSLQGPGEPHGRRPPPPNPAELLPVKGVRLGVTESRHPQGQPARPYRDRAVRGQPRRWRSSRRTASAQRRCRCAASI